MSQFGYGTESLLSLHTGGILTEVEQPQRVIWDKFFFPWVEGQVKWTLKSLPPGLSFYLYLNLSISSYICNQQNF